MQQLYARIKRSSKYYGQGEKNALFEVFIDTPEKWEYVVIGGPGGRSCSPTSISLLSKTDAS